MAISSGPFWKMLPYLSVVFQIGIMLLALLLMRHMISRSGSPKLSGHGPVEPEPPASLEVPEEVEVFTVDGLFALGALYKFDSVSHSVSPVTPKVRILRLKQVSALDPADLFQLRNFSKICHRKGIQLILSDVSPDFIETLRNSWAEEMTRDQRIFLGFHDAVKRASDFL